MNIQHETIVRNITILRDLRLRAGQLVSGKEHGLTPAIVDVIEQAADELVEQAEEKLIEVKQDEVSS